MQAFMNWCKKSCNRGKSLTTDSDLQCVMATWSELVDNTGLPVEGVEALLRQSSRARAQLNTSGTVQYNTKYGCIYVGPM
jgi:hypothetical protein